MECRDRSFMIAVEISFAGDEPHFEAVGKSYQITTHKFIKDNLIKIIFNVISTR